MTPTFDPEFDRRKLATFYELIPATYRSMERIANRRPRWPDYIEAMTDEEVEDGEAVGKGHGLYVADEGCIKLNADMDPLGLYLNFIHENLHHVLPEVTDEDINEVLLPAVFEEVTGRSVPESAGRRAGVVDAVYDDEW